MIPILTPSHGAVLTDGNTQESAPVFLAATNAMKLTGVEVFALGIGQDIDETELQQIASTSANVVLVEDIAVLGTDRFTLDFVLQLACSRG